MYREVAHDEVDAVIVKAGNQPLLSELSDVLTVESSVDRVRRKNKIRVLQGTLSLDRQAGAWVLDALKRLEDRPSGLASGIKAGWIEEFHLSVRSVRTALVVLNQFGMAAEGHKRRLKA